jgi:hypothetical protein
MLLDQIIIQVDNTTKSVVEFKSDLFLATGAGVSSLDKINYMLTLL